MSAQPIPPPDEADEPILSLIQRIKAGQTAPTSLGAEERRRCVEVLRVEGYTIPEIAQILKRNEKTIRRDIEKIRDEHALNPDPHLARRLVGEVVQDADASINRLRRIARETGASPLERATAESMAWKVRRDCTQLLQSLGYLPRTPMGIVASIHTDANPEPAEMNDDILDELEELDRIATESGIADLPEAQRCRATLEIVRRRRELNCVKTIQAKVEKQETQTHETSEESTTPEFQVNAQSDES